MKEELKELMAENRKAAAFITVFVTAQAFILAAKWGRPLIWDSNVYIGMGKAIFSGWRYGLWESFRPIVLPFISGILWFLGVPMRNFPRVLGVLISSATLVTFYVFSREFMGREKAFLALAGLGSTFLFVNWSNFFLTGIPASLLVLAALYAVLRGRYFTGGLMSSLAFLTRFPAALVGPSVAIFLLFRFYRSRDLGELMERSVRYGAGVLSLAVPFLIANQLMYGEAFHPLVSGALIPAGNPDRYMIGLWYLVESFKSGYYILSLMLLLAPLGIYSSVRRKLDSSFLLATTLIVFYGFFSLYPHKELRFLLLFLPLVAYFSAEGLNFLASKLAENSRLGRERLLELVAAVFVAGLLIGSFSIYDANTWENTERREFLEASGDILNGTVVSNAPEIVPYSDFRFIPVRPEHLGGGDRLDVNSCTSEKDTGFCKVKQEEIDYIAVNSCSWYCTPSIDRCRQKISEFEDQVKKDFETKFSVNGSRCSYTIYGERE